MDNYYLVIGFLGSMRDFKEFIEENKEDVSAVYINGNTKGRIEMKDGTSITLIENDPDFLRGYKCDQLMATYENIFNLVDFQNENHTVRSCVPYGFHIIYYGDGWAKQ